MKCCYHHHWLRILQDFLVVWVVLVPLLPFGHGHPRRLGRTNGFESMAASSFEELLDQAYAHFDNPWDTKDSTDGESQCTVYLIM